MTAEISETNYIAEAITEQWGERCPEYVKGCPCCEAWRQYDGLSAPPIPQDVATQAEWLLIEADLVGHVVNAYKPGTAKDAMQDKANFIRQIATTLTAQSSTIASAREVIEPFKKLADELFRTDDDGFEMNSRRSDNDSVWGFDRVELRYGHLRAARDWKGR